MSLKLPKLNLPDVPIRIKQEDGLYKIFDPIRKKWLLLTPEEHVRQSFLLYMNQVNEYPLSLAETEKQVTLNNTIKRADIVFYDQELRTRVIVECKAPNIKINNEAFEQVSRYHFALSADVLIVTNGLEHFAFKMDKEKIHFLNEIPNFNNFTDIT